MHRDLTPRNLFACVGGTVKILDFGIAKRHDGPSLTQTGHIHGTIARLEYLADLGINCIELGQVCSVDEKALPVGYLQPTRALQ